MFPGTQGMSSVVSNVRVSPLQHRNASKTACMFATFYRTNIHKINNSILVVNFVVT